MSATNQHQPLDIYRSFVTSLSASSLCIQRRSPPAVVAAFCLKHDPTAHCAKQSHDPGQGGVLEVTARDRYAGADQDDRAPKQEEASVGI